MSWWFGGPRDFIYIYTPLPWQLAGYWWGIFVIYLWLSDGFTDRTGSWIYARKVNWPPDRPLTMRYKTVIAPGLGLPPDYKYSALVSPQPHIVFWLPSSSLGYNYYIIKGITYGEVKPSRILFPSLSNPYPPPCYWTYKRFVGSCHVHHPGGGLPLEVTVIGTTACYVYRKKTESRIFRIPPANRLYDSKEEDMGWKGKGNNIRIIPWPFQPISSLACYRISYL